MLLALTADEEADQVLAGRDRKRGAGGRDRRGRRATDGACARLDRGGGDQLAGGKEPGGAQQRPARIDVVLSHGPAGERHFADHQRVLAQLGEECLLGGVEIRHLCASYGRSSWNGADC